MAVTHPGFVSFYPDEIRRIEDAQLMMIGISLDDLARMSLQQRYDLLELHSAQNNPKEYLKKVPSL